jgi:hypothetical protein
MVDPSAERLIAAFTKAVIAEVRQAAKVRSIVVVPWAEEEHILVTLYKEGRPPATLVVGRISRHGARKWVADRVDLVPSITEGTIRFHGAWSPPFASKDAAVKWCSKLLNTDSEVQLAGAAQTFSLALQDPAFASLNDVP